MYKYCGECEHWRIDKHCNGVDRDEPLCKLSGKHIKYDEKSYPINCLLRYEKHSEK